MATKPTELQIDEVLDWCIDADESGSHFPGMSYEDGVRAAINWMEGHGERPDE